MILNLKEQIVLDNYILDLLEKFDKKKPIF